MWVTKESNNKIHDNKTTYFMEKEPILHQDEEEVYNLFLSVNMLLHNADILSPKDPTFSLDAHPTNLGQNVNSTT